MERRIKTEITFINKRTNEVQSESFYGLVSEANVSDQIQAQNNYWKFNINKLGGHKVLNCASYLVFLK